MLKVLIQDIDLNLRFKEEATWKIIQELIHQFLKILSAMIPVMELLVIQVYFNMIEDILKEKANKSFF